MVKARFLIEDGVVVFIFNKRRYPMSCRDISTIISEKKEMNFSSALDPGGRCTVRCRKNRLHFHVEGNVFVLGIRHYEELAHDGARRAKGSRKNDTTTYEIDSLDDKGPTRVLSAPCDTTGSEKNDGTGQTIRDGSAQESPDLDRLKLMHDMHAMKNG